MAKLPAAWNTSDGFGSITQTTGNLLLETGDHLLLESGGFIVLEGIIITPKEDTQWDANTSKLPAWWATDGSSTLAPSNSLVQRTEQDITIRTEQDGTIRILQETVVTPKAPTQWDDL